MQDVPADELAELREIFNLVDTDHGGSIDKDEVKQLLDTLGIHSSEVHTHTHTDMTSISRSPSGNLNSENYRKKLK